MENINLMLGDNIESLKKLTSNSVDSIVTDPPYGLSFMNKKWDYQVPSVEFWKEVYRVLKPGGHILSFGGTRTYHRMVVNIEDAGFEIRDQIMWIYGSGFPKSHNIGKAVDKLEGNDREFIGDNPNQIGKYKESVWAGNTAARGIFRNDIEQKSILTKGNSPYEGWGTALKPANEPICLARKPLSEKSVAENVLKYSTGGINIDGCRVGTDDKLSRPINDAGNNIYGKYKSFGNENEPVEGRFPANIIFECICDEVIKGEKGENGKKVQKGDKKYGENNFTNGGILIKDGWESNTYTDKGDIHTNPDCPCRLLDEQSGESSRFFYQAKVSKAERNMGLDGFEDVSHSQVNNSKLKLQPNGEMVENTITKNNHPTVKPINLMTYLCRLITPKGGTVLDPFMGSGSSGISARLEGFNFIGMEMDEDYFKIAEARINNFEQYRKLLK